MGLEWRHNRCNLVLPHRLPESFQASNSPFWIVVLYFPCLDRWLPSFTMKYHIVIQRVDIVWKADRDSSQGTHYCFIMLHTAGAKFNLGYRPWLGVALAVWCTQRPWCAKWITITENWGGRLLISRFARPMDNSRRSAKEFIVEETFVNYECCIQLEIWTVFWVGPDLSFLCHT